MKLIKFIQKSDSLDKYIVYTSFLGMMSLISEAFRRVYIQFITIEGYD